MTQPLAPVATTTTTTTSTPGPAGAAIAIMPAPALSSDVQRRLSRLGTVTATLMGGWLLAKGYIRQDQATTVTDLIAGAVVLIGGNIVTDQWSAWYRKWLELKPGHAAVAATATTASDAALAELLAYLKARDAAVATPAPAAVPTRVTLSPGAIDTVSNQVLSAIEPRMIALEQAILKGAQK